MSRISENFYENWRTCWGWDYRADGSIPIIYDDIDARLSSEMSPPECLEIFMEYEAALRLEERRTADLYQQKQDLMDNLGSVAALEPCTCKKPQHICLPCLILRTLNP